MSTIIQIIIFSVLGNVKVDISVSGMRGVSFRRRHSFSRKAQMHSIFLSGEKNDAISLLLSSFRFMVPKFFVLGFRIHSVAEHAVQSRFNTLQNTDTARQAEMLQIHLN